TGDLRFSVKGLRFDGQFSGPATLIKPTQLTIAQIAEQLVSIEQARGYEQARYAAKQLDYDAICALVHHRNLDDNDPNLMPSRFMLLPGASDEQLKANDNLNAFPWPVHQDGPQYFSVAFLKQCLQLSGHLDSDEALPRWSSVDHEQDDTIDTSVDHEQDDTIDTSKLDLHPEDQQAEFDDTLKTAYDQYRQEHGVKKALRRYRPKEESQYTVQAGDTLHSIAEDQGYPYWTLLQEANKGRVETPDLLKEGSQLTLPKLHADELYQWLETQQERPRYWTQKGFFFPADYLSFSLTQTQEQTPLSGFLTGYQHEPHHVFYYLHALQSTRINLLLPAGPNLSLALSNQSLNTPQQPLSLVPYRPERSDQALESTDSDRPLPKGLTFEQNTTDTQEKTDKDA
ncbi:MAG: LysM domain-containing protein, partial [Reinekea sp.]